MEPARAGLRIETDGFAIVEGVLDRGRIGALLEILATVNAGAAVRERGGAYAVRNLLDVVPAVRELADAPAVRALVEPVLGSEARPVRGILFDKTPDANWKVPWHQDLTIAVRERREVEGFGPWSVKAEVLHVQPPVAILEHMLAVRVHLDDCAAANGAVRVLAGSHRHGRLPAEQIQEMAASTPATTCEVRAGGALLMRPLLLHASSPAASPAHRRVVHIEFAGCGLPGGLEWL